MRAICKRFRDSVRGGKSSPRRAFSTLAYLYRQGRNQGDVLAIEGRAIGGGVIVGDAQIDALALAGRAPAGKSEVSHFVIAAESRDVSKEVLLRSGHDWAGRYAVGRSYVLAVHRGHVHVLAETYDAHGRALHFSAREMAAMRRLEFTKEFEPNPQGPGKFPGASGVHPESKRLAARQVALRLVNGDATWEEMLRKKEIVPARVDKEGRVTSFLCHDDKGREIRVRVATVEKLAARERGRRAQRAANNVGRKAGQSLFDLADELSDALSQVEQPQPPSQGRAR